LFQKGLLSNPENQLIYSTAVLSASSKFTVNNLFLFTDKLKATHTRFLFYKKLSFTKLM